MSELAEQFCPFIHEEPITAVAYDSLSGLMISADASGEVALFRGTDKTPFQQFYHDGCVQAISIQMGEKYLPLEMTLEQSLFTTNISMFFSKKSFRERVLPELFGVISIQVTLLGFVSIDNILRVWDFKRANEING